MKDALEYKKYKKKQKQLLKELQNAECTEPGSGDVWESVDMKKTLHPIGYYINNREEMIRQIFTVIHGERLRKMLPPLLKDVDLDELKADCLIHLVGMSSKRIKAILEGRELDVSSDDSDSDESVNTSNSIGNIVVNSAANSNDLILTQQKKLKGNNKSATAVSHSSNYSSQILEDGCSIISGDDMLEIGLTNSDLCDDFFESNDNSKSPKNKRKKLKLNHQPLQQTSVSAASAKNLCDSVDGDLTTKGMDNKINAVGDENSDTKGKTLLEILELEMRARAIRALLKRDDSPTASASSSSSSSSSLKKKQCPTESDIKTAESQSEIIDLTIANDSSELLSDSIKSTSVNEVLQIMTSENLSDNEKNMKKEKNDSEVSDNCIVNSGKDNELKSQPLSIMDLGDKTEKPGHSDKNVEDKSASGNSWAERWLEKKSKDVKRLVSTSKMCTTIRNKMKKSNIRNIIKKPSSHDSEIDDKKASLMVQCDFKGSIDEYNMLVKHAHQNEESLQLDSEQISAKHPDSSLPSVSEEIKDIEAAQNITSHSN